MSADEAQILNNTRATRIKNILLKRLETFDETSTVEEKIAYVNKMILELDTDFELRPSSARAAWTLQDEIETLARETALNYAGSVGQVFDERRLQVEITRFSQDPRLIAEAERRYNIRKNVAESTLKDLGLL